MRLSGGARWLVVLGVLALLGGSPGLADDDDDGGGAAGGGAAGGGGGGGGGGDGPDGQARMPLGGAPPSGRVLQDLRSFLGAFAPGAAAPPAPPPAPVAAAPAPAPRPAQPPARPDSVPRELAIIGLDDAALARLQASGFTVIEEAPAGFLPGRVARLGLPTGLSAAAARERARALAPAARVDLNHLYRPGQAGPGVAPGAVPATPLPAAIICPAARIGMIDTGVDPATPALAGLPIERLTRRGAGRAPSSPTHGTAVAALLAAQLGPAPILAIDAFHRTPDGDAADAFDLAAALGLMLQHQVAVVNLSFAGPANEVLALATERAAAAGLLLAAAAGNEGQASPPRYPAAYPWVIAVTAVDRERRPFIRAGRGSHLAFAAPGVGLPAPAGRGTLSGTSYAVPFVAAAFAQAMVSLDAATATQRLARAAFDLGAPGRDPVYGHGLVRPLPGCGAG